MLCSPPGLALLRARFYSAGGGATTATGLVPGGPTTSHHIPKGPAVRVGASTPAYGIPPETCGYRRDAAAVAATLIEDDQ